MRVNVTRESANTAGSQTFQQQPGCRFQLCDAVRDCCPRRCRIRGNKTPQGKVRWRMPAYTVSVAQILPA